jgi:hypothetical protein
MPVRIATSHSGGNDSMSSDDLRAMFVTAYTRPDGLKAMWVGSPLQGGNYVEKVRSVTPTP